MSRNLIAILRGITPDEVADVVAALLTEGIEKIEIPLNSPSPFISIERMITLFVGQGIFGAGTVLNVGEVKQLAAIGADMIVSPNCDTDVIRATKALGMLSYPGVMTPSECFAALHAGADGLKFFPSELITPSGLQAMRAILPASTMCFAVGGGKPENFANWHVAGVDGFGVGSAVYKVGDNAKIVASKARAIVAAYDAIKDDF